MNNKNLFFLLLLISTLFACQGKRIDGHWHLKKEDIKIEEESIGSVTNKTISDQFAILDIKNEEGIWNKNKYDLGGIPLYIDRTENRIETISSECFRLEFNYKIYNDTLRLKNTAGDFEYTGIKCHDKCCDKQVDEFLNYDLDIDLPIDTDTTLSDKYNIYRLYEQRIFIGNKKNNWSDCSLSPRLYVNNKFITLLDIPIVIASQKVRVPIDSRDQIQYSLYTNKDVEMRFIIPLLQQFKQHGISYFNLAVREDTNLEKAFNLRLLKLDLNKIEEPNEEMTLSAFLKTQNNSPLFIRHKE